jgi:hypothetical protein
MLDPQGAREFELSGHSADAVMLNSLDGQDILSFSFFYYSSLFFSFRIPLGLQSLRG